MRSPFLPLLAVAASVLLACCAHTPHLVGEWREVGKTATLEFSEGGSFRAVDNQGMAVRGKYTLVDSGRLRFEILHPDSTAEVVIVGYSVKGDELTIMADHPSEVERYRRLKQ